MWQYLYGSAVKNLPANAGDAGLIPGLGRSPGGGDNPLQYSCLGNPIDRGAWWATVHGVSRSQTGLKDWVQACIFYVLGATYLLSAESKLQNWVRGFHQDVYRLAETCMYVKIQTMKQMLWEWYAYDNLLTKIREEAEIPLEKIRKDFLGDNDPPCES